MLTDVFTAIAPAGTDGTGSARMPGGLLPSACTPPWYLLPGTGAPSVGLLLGGDAGVQGGAVPTAAAVRFRTVQHVIEKNTTPTGTTLGIHCPGRPQS